MNKYVKTTKGIYELNAYRHLTDYPIIDNGRVISNKQKLFANKAYIYYGDVVAQSDNLNELIEYAVDIHKETNKVSAMYPVWLPQPLDIYRRIGVIKVGDDLVKVADWDNEKGEWKLYER